MMYLGVGWNIQGLLVVNAPSECSFDRVGRSWEAT